MHVVYMQNIHTYVRKKEKCYRTRLGVGTRKVEKGEPEVHSHPWLHSKFRTNLGYENPVSNSNKDTRFMPWSCDRRMGTQVKGTHRILGSVGSEEWSQCWE